MCQALEDPVKGGLVQACVDLHVCTGRQRATMTAQAHREHHGYPGTRQATEQAALCVSTAAESLTGPI